MLSRGRCGRTLEPAQRFAINVDSVAFLVHRFNLLHPTKPYFFERFFGTLAPFMRASESIAIACFLLLTFLPDRPLLSVPALRFFMARRTFFAAPLEYFLFFAFFAIAQILAVSGATKSKLSVRPKVHFLL
jgi:hypothetical protein